MIKFFRKIRQRLLSENRLGKYFLYAIGEIVLVVIGILIALQINNWNETQRNKAFERETLAQIQTNLVKDKTTLEIINKNFKRAIRSSNKILESDWDPQDKDSLKYWLAHIVRFDRFQPLTNAYEVAKSRGLDLISNKELRFLLGTYYDDEAQHAIKSIEDIELSFTDDWLPIMRQEALDMKFGQFVQVKDESMFYGDSSAITILKLNRDNYGGGSHRIEQVMGTIETIQDLIEKELSVTP
jgi:hypothetical protein